MNTITSNSNTIDLYAQKKILEAKILEQIETKKREKQKETDSINIGQQSLQTLSTSAQDASASNPFNSLVADGIITEDQSNAVLNAFQSTGNAIQTSGTYSNKAKHINPLDALVKSGAITQDQGDSIKSVLQNAIKVEI